MDKDAVGKVGDVVSTHLYAAVSAALKRIEAVLAKHGCPQGAEMADWLDAALAQQPAAQAAGLTDEQWYDLAQRHANADWNGSGFMGAVKALCADYGALLSRAAPSGEPVAVVRNNPDDIGTVIDALVPLEVGAKLYAAPQPGAQQAEQSGYRCADCKAPLPAGYACGKCGSDAAEEIEAEQPAEEARGADDVRQRFERIKRLALDAGAPTALPVVQSLRKIVRECIDGAALLAALAEEARGLVFNESREREAFESKFVGCQLDTATNGEYLNPYVEHQWEGWRQRALLAAPAAGKKCDGTVGNCPNECSVPCSAVAEMISHQLADDSAASQAAEGERNHG